MPHYEVRYADDEPRVIEAATRGRAAYLYALNLTDCWPDAKVGDIFKRLRSRRLDLAPVDPEQQAVERFNQYHPVGTPVVYWTGVREGDGRRSRTRSVAQLLSGHTAVVWVEGEASCISLTHVEVAG